MNPEPEGMAARELLHDLSSIKLRKPDREYRDLCKKVWKECSVLPPDAMTKLRKMYKRYRVAMNELYEAREGARKSMLREKHRAEMKALENEDPDDFGW